MVVIAANDEKRLGHVAVLIDYVAQAVELVANLDVVRTPPATLEEGHVLVELVMLVGVEPGKAAKVRRSGISARLLQGGGQRIAAFGTSRSSSSARVVTNIFGVGLLRRARHRTEKTSRRASDLTWRAVGTPHKIGLRGRPAKVVIVRKEMAVTSGGYDLRCQADVSAEVGCRGPSTPT